MQICKNFALCFDHIIGCDAVRDREDGFEALCHSAPLRFFIFTSTQCNNRGLPNVAVAVRDAGENDNLTFFGCLGQNGTHET